MQGRKVCLAYVEKVLDSSEGKMVEVLVSIRMVLFHTITFLHSPLSSSSS